jgi:GH15 family glucan-1,4-alpha-glucosidase
MKLEKYGFIGDTETGALVGSNGSIDWLCMPRFDSDACFAALLGDAENGCWRIWPAGDAQAGKQSYRGETLILETLWETETGVVRLIDCMPPRGTCPCLIRTVEGVSGRVSMEMQLTIRFDYGVTVPWVRKHGAGLTAIAGPNGLYLQSDVPMHGAGLSTVASFEVSGGEQRSFVLSWFASAGELPRPISAAEGHAHAATFWKEWVSHCCYEGKWRDAVIRSLLTLKGLTYAPTGGVIAALTTSLPEKIGGVRNWDYRYCWIRDATLTLYALMQAGFTEEAIAWRNWLLRAAAGDPAQMQLMYGVGGERRLTELELPHLRGYEGSRPARIGNAASEQFQLDVYGEIMDAMHLARKIGIPADMDSWALQRHLVEFVASNWKEPDEGIWEVRGPRRHFTHSKMMAWVALDRAVKAVEEFACDGDLPRWRALRDEIHAEVCTRGFNRQRNAFTQFYGSDQLDASLLMMPQLGFLPATDARVKGTILAIERELVADGFVLRYRSEDPGCVDGLPAGEGAFLACSFWMVDCLHAIGRHREAEEWFERLLALRSPLGLLSEEYDVPSGRLVGNLPQAFSHLALINSAYNLAAGKRTLSRQQHE